MTWAFDCSWTEMDAVGLATGQKAAQWLRPIRSRTSVPVVRAGAIAGKALLRRALPPGDHG